MNSSKNKLNSKISWFFNLEPNIHWGSVWIQLILLKTENWKYYSKIIFKCVNSAVGPVNSAWTVVNSAWIVHFVSCIVNPCDVTVHTRWEKKETKLAEAKRKCESKQILSMYLDTNEKLKLFYYLAYFFYYS